MELSKMLTVSTGHITQETARLLDNPPDDFPLCVYPKAEYGWFIYIQPDADDESDVSEQYEFPADLKQVIDFAIYEYIDVLCIDRDGGFVNLPVYEW